MKGFGIDAGGKEAKLRKARERNKRKSAIPKMHNTIKERYLMESGERAGNMKGERKIPKEGG